MKKTDADPAAEAIDPDDLEDMAAEDVDGVDPLEALSDAHRVFVLHYLQSWNATAAAALAGYSERSAHNRGMLLLRRADVRGAINAYLAELKSSTDESLARLSRRARVTMRDFVEVDEEDPYTLRVNWKKALDTGAIDAVKSLRPGPYGLTFTLYDAQAADIAILTDARNAGPKILESQLPEGFEEALRLAYPDFDKAFGESGEGGDEELEEEIEEADDFDIEALLPRRAG